MSFKTLLGLLQWDLCIASWYPKFDGSHFDLPPSSVHRMTGLGGYFVWTFSYVRRYTASDVSPPSDIRDQRKLWWSQKTKRQALYTDCDKTQFYWNMCTGTVWDIEVGPLASLITLSMRQVTQKTNFTLLNLFTCVQTPDDRPWAVKLKSSVKIPASVTLLHTGHEEVPSRFTNKKSSVWNCNMILLYDLFFVFSKHWCLVLVLPIFVSFALYHC